MKLAKKIAVVLLALALLVSSSVLFASAEFTEDNIEDVLEYYCTSTFVLEDLNTADAQGVVEALEFSQHSVVADPDNGENFLWYIVPQDMRHANLVMPFAETPVDTLVLSTKVMLGAPDDDGDAQTVEKAPKLNFTVRTHEESGLYQTSAVLTIDCQAGEIRYFSYDSETGKIDKANVLELEPVYNSWYELDFVFDFSKSVYSFALKNGDDTVEISNIPVGSFAYASEVRMFLEESRLAKMWIDGIKLYEGSFIRDTDESGKNAKAIEYLKELNEFSKGNLDIATKLRIAEVYKILLIEKGFTPNEGIDDYDVVLALIEEDKAYINRAYMDAILAYVGAIDATKTYAERVEYLVTVDSYNSLLPTDEAEFLLLDGMDADSYALVNAARLALETERANLLNIETGSKAYIAKAGEYNASNKDYTYMTGFLRDLLAIEHVDISYPGVADVKAGTHTALDNKIKLIDSVVNSFVTRVDRMQQIVAAVPENEVCGDSFEELYYKLYNDYKDGDNVVKGAKSLYNGGVIYSGLDNSTYPGLSEKIGLYLAQFDYINARVASTERFLSAIRLAKSATQYNIILEKVEEAAKYIDDDLSEYTVEEKYEGVAQAKEDYLDLVQLLKDLENNSKKYVAEVEKVKAAMDKGYNALKAAVSAALAVKDKGDYTGMEGIKEANIALSNAQAVIECYEGYSKILIDSVAALQAQGLSISERRALIVAANDAKAESTDEITGVTDAKTKLDSAITKYNSDIAAANAAYGDAMVKGTAISSAVVPVSAAQKSYQVIAAIFKKEN